jgi:hypothetical protein
MENIIKQTLEKTLNELYDQIESKEKEHEQILSNAVYTLVGPLDDLFKEFSFKVTDTEILFRHNNKSSWYSFSIQRRTNYGYEEKTYGKPTLHYSSYSDLDEDGLKMTVCLGILARHNLTESPVWIDLMNVMNYQNHLYKTELKELISQTYKIRDEIKRIEREEQSQVFTKIFGQGTFKLKDSIRFDYGNSKWDYVRSDEFFWEENKGGKTYTLSYMEERRANPYYDENGNTLEPIMERVKRTIDKRIKKADMESYVRYNTDKMV